jgi:hypothetical protein
MRRVFHFQERREPLAPSCFSYLPRDIAHLVLVNLTLPVLCGLKRVSQGVANACRRALCSEDFMEHEENYDAMSEAIGMCAFSFPMRVFVEEYDDISGLDRCDVKNPLVIHEFELMFCLDDKIVAAEDVRAWLYELMQMMERPREKKRRHMERMRVLPVRFCIETIDGIFFSERTLREHMDLDYGTGVLSGYGLPGTKEAIYLLELAGRLTPYAMVGGRRFVAEVDAFYYDQHERSLLYCLLHGGLCSK